MALQLRDLYQDTKQQFRLELLAGETGLDNTLKWVYVAEDHTTTDFLRGGELIITTGVLSRSDPAWLLRFLERVHAKGTCGVILNVGRYLQEQDISQEVLDFCRREQFPLFTMPWHIHIYDITREYYNRIFQDSRRSEELSLAIHTLATCGPGRDEALALLEKNHFPAKGNCHLAILLFEPARESALTDNERALNRVLTLLHPLPCYLATAGTCLLLCRTGNAAETAELVTRLLRCLEEVLPGVPCRIGISGCLDGPADLPEGLSQARAAAALQPEKSVAFYEELGFFKLLAAVGDPALPARFAGEQLSAVRAYDAKHHSDFARTLRLYLELDHSVQAVAERSFCHRNTVSHRLQLLREMGYRLDDPDVCFSLLAAFRTEDYLRLRQA